jgi:hypothetical protein
MASARSPADTSHNDQDPNLVTWKPNDRLNPRNWSTTYKSWLTFQLGMMALTASLGSSILSPTEDVLSEIFGISKEVTVLNVSLYM